MSLSDSNEHRYLSDREKEKNAELTDRLREEIKKHTDLERDSYGIDKVHEISLVNL